MAKWEASKIVEFLALECYQWVDCFRVLVGFDFAAIVIVEFVEGDMLQPYKPPGFKIFYTHGIIAKSLLGWDKNPTFRKMFDHGTFWEAGALAPWRIHVSIS